MEIKLNVYINESEINIKLDDQNSIKISSVCDYDSSLLYFVLKNNDVIYIGNSVDSSLVFDKTISITVPSNMNIKQLESVCKVALNKLTDSDISDELNLSNVNEYKDKISFILKNFGYDLFKTKALDKTSSGKARHKWTKEISKIKFTAKLRGGEGTAIWQKKDELVLLSGAKLVKDPQLNKDGSINFSAQFAQKLRLDYADKVVDYITTEDIVFQSPNQLGLFLFYGGQNTWAELKDENNKSLDEWSIVQ